MTEFHTESAKNHRDIDQIQKDCIAKNAHVTESPSGSGKTLFAADPEGLKTPVAKLGIKFFDPVIHINCNPIEVSNSQLIDDEHGAGVFFLGRVRKRNCGKDVIAVEYESFVPLAIKTLSAIAFEAQDKFCRARIEVSHRIGRLNVGEISVAIIVSTPHRDESYKISRYIIEEIKTRAPIWKKEYYTDGETEWLKGHALCQHGMNE